jgi:hypothetical protein
VASSIDATKPTAGAALTADVRNNFSAAKSEIEALQAADATLAPKGAVTLSGLTMSTACLLGRDTASTGAIEEITLGTNLSFSGTTLNASGALTNFAEAVNTAAPNATVPVVSLTATNAATNVDIALVPKGTGAIVVQVADGTTTGGNKRGAGAVDLQTTRGAPDQVASGSNSFIAGKYNTVSGVTSAAFGQVNNVSGPLCFAVGSQNTVSSGVGYASAFGNRNTVSGTASMTIGSNNTADASYSIAAGWYATSRGIASTMQHAGSRRAAVGDRQFRRIPQSTVTSNDTATVLTSTGAAESTGNTWIVPANYSGILHGFVVARNTANNDTIGWEIKAMVSSDSTAASVAILGSASVAAVGTADAAMSSCSLAVGANTTNGSITLTATGIAATTIAWSGYIHCIENG